MASLTKLGRSQEGDDWWWSCGWFVVVFICLYSVGGTQSRGVLQAVENVEINQNPIGTL